MKRDYKTIEPINRGGDILPYKEEYLYFLDQRRIHGSFQKGGESELDFTWKKDQGRIDFACLRIRSNNISGYSTTLAYHESEIDLIEARTLSGQDDKYTERIAETTAPNAVVLQ